MKNVFVVLSPPRCGSSCAARALQALGINLGTDLMAPMAHNPKGFFEDNALNSINAQLAEYVRRFQNGEHTLDALKSEVFTSACEILENKIKLYDNYGFKDPRTVKFIPFWQKVFETLNLNDNYLIAVRNPLCYMQSMASSTFEKALLIWLSNLMPTIALTKNKKRVVLDYDEMMQSPYKQLERISKALNLFENKNEDEWKTYCDEFLDKSLHHHQNTFEQLKSHQGIFPLCVRVYTCFLKLARDETTFQNEDFQKEWKLIGDHLQENELLYRYMEYLLHSNDKYEEELKKAQEQHLSYEKSLSWRITRPLRSLRKIFIEQQMPNL